MRKFLDTSDDMYLVHIINLLTKLSNEVDLSNVVGSPALVFSISVFL